MPYIKESERLVIDDRILVAASDLAGRPGNLAYALSALICIYRDSIPAGRAGGYAERAEIVGVLETLKLEFVRQVLSPYEDKKREQNGDIEW